MRTAFKQYPSVRFLPFAMVALALSLVAGGWVVTLLPTIRTGWFDSRSFLLIFCVCFLGGIAVTWLTSWRNPRFLLTAFFIAFMVRVVLAVVFYYYLSFFNYRTGLEGNDDVLWDLEGRAVASGGLAAMQTRFSAGYILFNAVVYRLAGPYPLSVRVANALVGALIPVVGYHLSRQLFGNDERLARRIATWLVWWPSQLVFSGLHQKDIVLALAMTTGVLAIVQVCRQGPRLFPVVLFLGSLAVAASIRGLASDLLVLTAASAAVYWGVRNKRPVMGVMLLVPVLGLILLVVRVLQRAIEFGDVLGVQGQYLLRYGGIVEQVEGAIREQPAGVNSLLFGSLAPLRVVVGTFVFLIAPFPPGFIWQSNFASSLLSLVVPLWFLLLPYLFAAVLRLIRRGEDSLPALAVIPVAVTAVANALILSGTIPRQRVMVEPLIVFLAAWVFHTSSMSERKRYFGWSVGLAFFAIAMYQFLRSML